MPDTLAPSSTSPLLIRLKKNIIVLIVLVAGFVVLLYLIKHTQDIRRSADSQSGILANASVVFSEGIAPQNIASIQSVREPASFGYTNTKYTFNINFGFNKKAPVGSRIKILMPRTAVLSTDSTHSSRQYGWTMKLPPEIHVDIKPGELTDITEYVELNTNAKVYIGYANESLVRVPFLEIVPNEEIPRYQNIALSVRNVKTQSLSFDKNPIKIFFDEEGNNNFVEAGHTYFNIIPKGADSLKIFASSFYSPGQEVKVNVTPINITDNLPLIYPNNDELFSGFVTLRLGSGSTTQIVWPDGESSENRSYYTFEINPSVGCTRNCTTKILSVKPINEGFFFLEGKIEGYDYNEISVSNPSSSDFLSDTAFSNKKIYFGDWHAHFIDIGGSIKETVDFGKLSFGADFVGANYKTNYDRYSGIPQLDEDMFADYARQTTDLNQLYSPDNFLAVYTAEWPKVLSDFNPFSSQHSYYGSNLSSLFWIHNVMLFPNEANTKLISQESNEFSNFFRQINEIKNLGGTVTVHHMERYDFNYYDSSVISNMRVFGFNTYESGNWAGVGGIDNILTQGAEIGFVGESDSHQATSVESGQSGVYMDSLSNEDLIENVKNKRTYALTGFGKPLLYFGLESPKIAVVGDEAMVNPGETLRFRIKALLSKDIQYLKLRRGKYGEAKNPAEAKNYKMDEVDLSYCIDPNNKKKADCIFEDSADYNFKFYTIVVGSSPTAYQGSSYSPALEHFAWSSPIWISKSPVTFDFDSVENVVSGEGQNVTLITNYKQEEGTNAKNMAIQLTNRYPTKENMRYYPEDFNIPLPLDEPGYDWYTKLTDKKGLGLDIKTRLIDGQYVFGAVNLNSSCDVFADECFEARVIPGEEKNIYINVDPAKTYSTNTNEKYPCTTDELLSGSKICTYAVLFGKDSKVENKGGKIKVTWSIGFEPIIGERVYKLFATAFTDPSRHMGWRQVGSVLANPTIPDGELYVKEISGNDIKIASKTSPTDNMGNIKGMGATFFRVMDAGINEDCVFTNQDNYSAYILNTSLFPDYEIPYEMTGPDGERKICYYFKDLAGLRSEIKTIPVVKDTGNIVPTILPTPSASPTETPRPVIASPTPNPVQITPTPVIPTPQPVTNNPPVFITYRLGSASSGKFYKQKIYIADIDKEPNMNMVATGFPQGLTLSNCKIEEGILSYVASLKYKTLYSCSLSGYPRSSGKFTIKTTVFDSQKNFAYKNYELLVRKKTYGKW